MDKKKLLVSFSGGETSAYMAQYLWKHKQDEFDMVFVFANTGLENEQTLKFVKQCSDHFGFDIHWVEAVVQHGVRKGTLHKVVNYETASREGEPFEDVIKKYGVPNQAFPHCTREAKLSPITSFTKSYFGTRDYYTAIGIRSDEADRINSKAGELKLIYPLISKNYIPMTKPKINFWWSQQPFRLELKGYQGNCITCWKKADKKLFQIYKENPSSFDFMNRMEQKYGMVRGEKSVFFRKQRSTNDIIEAATEFDGVVLDDADVYDTDLIGGESCEVWSSCGD